jgi:hypothetical protein
LNNGKGSIVLYGSGFDATSRVYIDNVGGMLANVLFVSPDGKILVFAVPSTVTPGSHSIALTNQYSSLGSTAIITVIDATLPR